MARPSREREEQGISPRGRTTRVAIQAVVAVGGLAALSWEVLWQLETSLALGASAHGTAITLAATMGGITIGSLLGGRWLADRPGYPIRMYGLLEAVIGLSGLLMLPGFRVLEWSDAMLYGVAPALAPGLHLLGIVLLLGPPTLAMGATIPVFARVASAHGTSIAGLYGINTIGAAAGSFLIAFLFIPAIGVSQTCQLVASLNLFVFFVTQFLPPAEATARAGVSETREPARVAPAMANVLVFCTGLVTFGLEVAWFRSLRAAFQSVTESFVLMLAAVLIPLGIAARLVPLVRRTGIHPATLLGLAGALILLGTPFVERIDLLAPRAGEYGSVLLGRFALSLAAFGPPLLLLGMVLPWLLDEYGDPRRCGWLYATNTAGSVLGSLLAAWILLPWLGFARASWLLGAVIVVVAATTCRERTRLVVAAAGALTLLFAVATTSSLGRDRVPGMPPSIEVEILAYDEGPDSTISVVSDSAGVRSLVIDGFIATSERVQGVRYMEMMGRLPMLLHPNPQTALVICFGTGQTANAVRREGPAELDIVDLNPAVFGLAKHFRSNDAVLEDTRVRAIAMDGRAWLRRAGRRYDVITLEPMPPYFAGVNALYSEEFYRIAADKLEPGGIVAQWLPLHLMPPYYAASAASTFQAVFPDAILWLHPAESTGILLGRSRAGNDPLGSRWPGLARPGLGRSIPPNEFRSSVVLDPESLTRYATRGQSITDDNQLLAYGPMRRRLHEHGSELQTRNVRLVRHIAQEARRKGGPEARAHGPSEPGED